MDLIALRHHAVEDPHCGKEANPNIGLPDTLGDAVGKSRFEQLALLYGEDPFEEKIHPIKKNSTKENPNLIPSDEKTRNSGCLCNPDQHGVFWQMLYKNLPTRCHCGHWKKLVSYKEYYTIINTNREKKYGEVQNTPEMKELEVQLEKYQSEFDELAKSSMPMNNLSPGAFEMSKKMSDTWKGILSTRHKIENILDA